MRPRKFALLFCLLAAVMPAQQKVDKATMDRWMQELSNWGRWGPQDQMGTINLITPAKRKQAAALVKDGVSISLSAVMSETKEIDNPFPLVKEMVATPQDPDPMFGMDVYTIRYHGPYLSHFDALSHMFYNGKLYNGYSADQINKQGAAQLSVEAYRNGIVSRGVLMDIPRLKGVKYLENTVIMPADLDAWEKQAKVKVGSGDIVIIRTGRWARRAEKGAWDTDKEAAGLHPSCARWFHQRDVAAIVTETHSEAKPDLVDGIPFPMHQLLIIAMGTPMFDNCDLEALSEAAAARRRWEFMFAAAPLVVHGGTGSPMNPLAIF